MVILFYDLSTRDGRKAIELREFVVLGDGGMFASPKSTVYSCAYTTQAERITACRRALGLNMNIIDFIDGSGKRAVLL